MLIISPFVAEIHSFLSGSNAQGGLWPSQEVFQVSLLPASVLHFLVLITRRYFSRPSIHLRFGLPFLRVTIGWALKAFLVVRSSSILTT
ncbi:hypothetical protein TNCV_567621 [Trichonephila clavipes]|nr:hypothetical protein TNCV_567621 [Trichonephila clavipes]